MMKKTVSAILSFALCVGMLTSCGLSEEAQNVKDMIDALPDTYSEDINDDMQKAEEAYNNLSSEDKDSLKIKKLNILKDSRTQYIIDNTKTFGATPEEFAAMLSDESTDYNDEYTTTDNGDGTSNFEFTERVAAINWNGTILTDNKEIISLTAALYSTDSEDMMNKQLILIEAGFALIMGKEANSIKDGKMSDAIIEAIDSDDGKAEYENYYCNISFDPSGTAYITMTPKN